MTDNEIKYHAFQNGLDSVYDQWGPPEIAQFTRGLQQSYGEYAVEAFNDGVKTAEVPYEYYY
jgi:hypothetical protein